MGGFDLVVTSQAAIAGEPCVGSFDDPAAGKNGKSRSVGFLDDHQASATAQASGSDPVQEFSGVAAVGPDELKPTKPTSPFQEEFGAFTIR